MARKDISPEEAFDNVNPSLKQYVELAEQSQNSSQAIFDDILTTEHRYIQSCGINQGGMKKILKTLDALTNRPVAKAILIDFEDSSKTESFLREARLTAALEHPNIIPVYDIGVDEKEGPYFIMKLVGGQNLAEVLKKLAANESEKEYSLRDLMIIYLKVCDAVAYAHSKGIVHLDLKPENIQVGDYGEVLVCDWGLAKVLEQTDDVNDFGADLDPDIYNEVTLDGYIKGTPGYMAPEQVNADLGPKNQRTDIYALGGILYSLLCYKAPFESDTLQKVLAETLIGDLPLPSERAAEGSYIPASLEAVAMKALEIDPEDRYQSVSELRQEINKWMGGFATEAENASFIKALWLLLKRHTTVSFLLLIILFTSIYAVFEIKENERKAIASERVAIANEKKATEALDLYIKEKELTELISDHAIEQLKAINDYHIENLEYNKAIEFIDKTLEFQPENEFLNALKGETHFYRQEYNKALLSLSKAGKYKEKEPYSLMYNLAPKYAKYTEGKDFLEAARFVELLDELPEKYSDTVFNFEAAKYSSAKKYRSFFNDLEKMPQLENHLEFCRLMLIKIQDSKGSKELKINFNYSFEKDGIHLDMSNSEGLDRARYLIHLPLANLNLENTFFWRYWIFDHYHLKSVNIRNTNIEKIAYITLVRSGLKEITLTKEQYEKSDIRSNLLRKIKFNIK